MSSISEKIKEYFPDLAIMKNSANSGLFTGRNLPSFVKDYIIRRFAGEDGIADHKKVSDYLANKMPNDIHIIKNNLLAGEQVNITVRFVIKSDLASGRTTFSIPDAQIFANAFISPVLLDEFKEELVDGEHWGNITLNYVEPQGRRNGYIEMVSFKSFEPYRIDYSYFLKARENFSIDEWVDVLIATMEYDPDTFSTMEQKLEFITRLLILVEPRLNMIELGPKGTGKSYVYNNISIDHEYEIVAQIQGAARN
jgi:ATP-dependent Lon protease